MSEGRPPAPLGEVILEIAGRHNIRRPTSIRRRMMERKGRAPSTNSIVKWIYGDSRPDPKKGYLEDFADAFDASAKDRVRLAVADTFRSPVAA